MQSHGTLARCGAALVVTLAATAALQVPVAAQGRNGETLYERLGGYDFIARFVDTAFPRVASDERLARLFRGHSVDSQMRQRQLIVDALCYHTGGPCIYIGRDLTTVHVGLGITDEDWTAFMEVITGALSELDVPAEVKGDFVRLFEEKLRPTVVVR
jgi:hemoglobin